MLRSAGCSHENVAALCVARSVEGVHSLIFISVGEVGAGRVGRLSLSRGQGVEHDEDRGLKV